MEAAALKYLQRKSKEVQTNETFFPVFLVRPNLVKFSSVVLAPGFGVTVEINDENLDAGGFGVLSNKY